jgi:carboxymethylenebutenolidase
MPAESVTIPSGASTIGGYLALPEGAGPHPAVVVIHEAFGLTDNIREIARRFADHGYAALAVDLFSGRNRVLCMARLMTAMLRVAPDRFGIRDLSAALGYLSTVPTIDAARLGAIGFCLGGGLAIAWACTDDRLQAIAPFYGTNPRPFKAVARLCPVVGSYPGRDFTAASGRRLDEALDGYGTRVTSKSIRLRTLLLQPGWSRLPARCCRRLLAGGYGLLRFARQEPR